MRDSSKRSERADRESESEKSQGRRRLLQILAMGGVVSTVTLLPEKWTKPVVEQILLPAHAQATGGADDDADDAADADDTDADDVDDTGPDADGP